MDLTHLFTLHQLNDGDTGKQEEIRRIALWSHLRIKITNVKTKHLLLLFTASRRPCHKLTLSQHPPVLFTLQAGWSVLQERDGAESADLGSNSPSHWLEDHGGVSLPLRAFL